MNKETLGPPMKLGKLFIIKSLIVLLFTAFSSFGFSLTTDTVKPALDTVKATSNSPSTKELLSKISDGFSSVAKKGTPSVVYIQVKTKAPERRSQGSDPFDFFNDEFFQRFFGSPPQSRSQEEAPQKGGGQGSGFIVSDDGYILTNNHVVKDADEITVKLENGKEAEATIVGTDPDTDLAVIKINESDLPFLDLGNSDDLDVGEWVIAIGSPFGLNATVTVGVVSAKGRNDLRLSTFEDFIQTDAAINPGNSGGPLLNLDGDVVGINTAIVSGSGGYMGIGFAIPSNMAKEIMRQIIDKGSVTRGFMGVTLQAIDQDLAKSFNLKNIEGVLITDVVKDSPASEAGLEQGDVILEHNGKKVQSLGAFRNAVALMPPESKLSLSIDRDGEKKQITVEIGVRPDTLEGMGGQTISKLGIDVDDLTPELAKKFGYQSADKGVIVSQVSPNSPAHKEGIRPGTIILSVNKQAVESVLQFHSLMKEAEKDNHVLLLLKQGPFTRFLALKLK